MREILFRGKTRDILREFYGKTVGNAVWIYGDLLQIPTKNDYWIMGQTACASNLKVIPETVGQYTGFLDKNGTKIFEGDIVKIIQSGEIVEFGIVDYQKGAFGISTEDGRYSMEDIGLFLMPLTVVGNIYDNKELFDVPDNNDGRIEE